jgi:hypothetical protein
VTGRQNPPALPALAALLLLGLLVAGPVVRRRSGRRNP